MSRDELVETLARSHRAGFGYEEMDSMWEDIPDAVREYWRAQMRRLMPEMVAFVAQWLEDADLYADGEGALNVMAARQWREEMGT